MLIKKNGCIFKKSWSWWEQPSHCIIGTMEVSLLLYSTQSFHSPQQGTNTTLAKMPQSYKTLKQKICSPDYDESQKSNAHVVKGSSKTAMSISQTGGSGSTLQSWPSPSSSVSERGRHGGGVCNPS